jgi:hypothetical protein
MQPYRGRINVVNLQTRSNGGCSEDLRAMRQRIDIISLLYFCLAENPTVCRFAIAGASAPAKRHRNRARWQMMAGFANA